MTADESTGAIERAEDAEKIADAIHSATDDGESRLRVRLESGHEFEATAGTVQGGGYVYTKDWYTGRFEVTIKNVPDEVWQDLGYDTDVCWVEVTKEDDGSWSSPALNGHASFEETGRYKQGDPQPVQWVELLPVKTDGGERCTTRNRHCAKSEK